MFLITCELPISISICDILIGRKLSIAYNTGKIKREIRVFMKNRRKKYLYDNLLVIGDSI